MPNSLQIKELLPEDTVSVVMVSYHTGPILWDSIASVLAQTALQELILVDNGNPASVREELSILAQKEPRFKLLINPDNKGFAQGCNVGAREAQGKYLLILNPDCIILPDTLKKGMDGLAAFPEAFMASCVIANPDYTEQSGSRRNILTPWVSVVESLGLHRLMPGSPLFPRINLHHTPLPASPFFIPAISGAFMLMKREIYQQLGGIDEGYFFHVEDLDFCLQIHKHGGKILFLPDLKVLHTRSSSNVSSIFIERYKAKGFARYFRKNFPHAYFPGFIPLWIGAIYFRLGCKILQSSYHSFFARFASSSAAEKEEKRIKYLKKHTEVPSELSLPAAPIILAGASSQIGLCVLGKALAAGIPVTALYHRNSTAFSHPNLTWKQSDLTDPQWDLGNNSAELLIYTSSLWLLPAALPTFAAQGVKRLICFSSTSIFGKSSSNNPYEQTLVSKLRQAEERVAELCAHYNIQWTILRPTLVYGIGVDQNVSTIADFIQKFGFFPIAGKAVGLRQPVHADDLAAAVFQALDSNKTHQQAYNLCGGEQLSYYEVVGRIFDALGKKRSIITLPFFSYLLNLYSKLTKKPHINGEIAERMNQDLVFDDSAARECFHYLPRNFLAGGSKDLNGLS